jgi:hypothetical protein
LSKEFLDAPFFVFPTLHVFPASTSGGSFSTTYTHVNVGNMCDCVCFFFAVLGAYQKHPTPQAEGKEI